MFILLLTQMHNLRTCLIWNYCSHLIYQEDKVIFSLLPLQLKPLIVSHAALLLQKLKEKKIKM